MAENYKYLVEESQRRALPREYCVPLFDDMRPELKRNIAVVLASAKRNFERSGTTLDEDALLEEASEQN